MGEGCAGTSQEQGEMEARVDPVLSVRSGRHQYPRTPGVPEKRLIHLRPPG